jgi:hypothetical protein
MPPNGCAVQRRGEKKRGMMKRLLVALFCMSASAICVTPNVASAGNGATTTPFKAAFVNGPTGYFECSGVRVVKTAPRSLVKDSETCDVTVGELVVPDGITPLGLSPPAHTWFSDYEYFVSPGGCLNPSVSGTITVKSKGQDRQTWTIVAYYDPDFVCSL